MTTAKTMTALCDEIKVKFKNQENDQGKNRILILNVVDSSFT